MIGKEVLTPDQSPKSKNNIHIWSWGWGGFGQLGTCEASFHPSPENITDLLHSKIPNICDNSFVTNVGGRGYEGHSFIMIDGQCFAVGSNTHGQLGVGHVSTAEVKLNKISLKDESLVSVSCGSYHSAFLTKDGTVYCCGEAEFGALGIPDTGDQPVPMKIHALEGKSIVQIECGDAQTIAITRGGEVYVWGCCWYFDDDDDDDIHHVPLSPQDISTLECPSICTLPSLVLFPDKVVVQSVSCGDCHSAALDEKGHVFTWGWGGMGQLGHGKDDSIYKPKKIDRLDNIKQVSCGADFTLVCNKKGNAFAFGNNSEGQCGIGDKSMCKVLSPYQVNGLSLFVEKIKCGVRHALAVCSSLEYPKICTVWAWGSNKESQVGQGKQGCIFSPTKLSGIEFSDDIEYSLGVGASHNIIMILK